MLRFEVKNNSAISFDLNSAPDLDMSVENAVLVRGIEYKGAYIVTPSQEQQVLPTALKTLQEDVIINPIPKNYGLITYNGVSLTVS